jgi:hypothetical protein
MAAAGMPNRFNSVAILSTKEVSSAVTMTLKASSSLEEVTVIVKTAPPIRWRLALGVTVIVI